MKGASKILPNNTALARAVRGGAVAKIHTPKQHRGDFRPWEDSQQRYVAWFRDLMEGEQCQCPDPACRRTGQQVHHEDHGADKDDRTIVWLSMHCHHDVRHAEGGCDTGWSGEAWTAEQFAAGCAAAALDNWLRYCTAVGANE